MKSCTRLVSSLLWLSILGSAPAADFTLKVADKSPPKELAPSITGALQPKAVQLLEGGQPALELWLASELPLKSKPAAPEKALETLKEATLVGAITLASARRDYREDEIPAGTYTMRFALQPQDGNHLGTAEYAYFLVLTPAKIDTQLDGLNTYSALVKASSKESSSNHPMVISLRPAASENSSPTLQTPAPDHKSIRLKLPAKAGAEKTSLTFDFVYEGAGKK